MEEVELSFQPAKTPAAEGSSLGGVLVLWHLLSLDAPTVAAVWTWFAARSARVELPPVVPVAMFCAVWLVYAGDRLLDTTLGAAGSALEERHWFHLRHRRGFRVTMLVVSMVLVPLVCRIPGELLRWYVGLGLLLACWFAAIHVARRLKLPKELAPGVFCAAAMFLPAWLGSGRTKDGVLAAALCFGLVIWLNCLTIFRWECGVSELAEAHWLTRAGVHTLREIGIATAVLPLVAMRVCRPELTPIFAAIALAAALLLALDALRGWFGRTELRAAADLVLLTPLLVAGVLRL